jgi:hypothetical protein
MKSTSTFILTVLIGLTKLEIVDIFKPYPVQVQIPTTNRLKLQPLQIIYLLANIITPF